MLLAQLGRKVCEKGLRSVVATLEGSRCAALLSPDEVGNYDTWRAERLFAVGTSAGLGRRTSQDLCPVRATAKARQLLARSGAGETTGGHCWQALTKALVTVR